MRIVNRCPVTVGDEVRYAYRCVGASEWEATDWERVIEVQQNNSRWGQVWKLMTENFCWTITSLGMCGIEVRKAGVAHEQNT